MKKKLISLMVCAISSAIFSSASIAQEYMFTYSKLYSQLKNNAKEGHEDVKVGFFFVNADDKSLCDIEKVWMEKQGKYEELSPVNGKEVVVPLDSNLKSANPLVFVRTPMDMRCDFSMVVMTKQPLSDKVYYQDIEKLLPQMQSMLEDLGGMFASWFTPDVEGLTLEFPNNTSGSISFSNGLAVDIVEHKARIRLADLKPGEYIELPAMTSRVLPWLPAAK
ncbi:DUF2987 domain-containing protein [Vibrio sp. TH_r3]|uniref:DUF2987 domain-containing protein n=1 Tax=Vibrio sp. TH_r3 TaxID=3082084 RepID=UPI002954C5A3|nr:DUF2987 domain-containing protein [Vibrio sp. TH_r3]MDV7104346.1 DUF2987 domain-containing protein [Vibrio sp. TH_r3]